MAVKLNNVSIISFNSFIDMPRSAAVSFEIKKGKNTVYFESELREKLIKGRSTNDI